MNETEKQIVEILEKLRPYLQRDGGDVEYVKFEDGIVYVQMLGAFSIIVKKRSSTSYIRVGPLFLPFYLSF